MGSRCSILNDTEHDVWITHGPSWTVLMASLGGVLGLLTAGAGLAAIGATVGVGGALLGGGVAIMTEGGIAMGATALTIAGLTAGEWTLATVVTSLSTAALSTALGIKAVEAEKLQKHVKDFQDKATLIKPGERYTWSGTLSLPMKVYLMNDKLQLDDRVCFTGPVADSENKYPISEYFEKLDVNKNRRG